MRRQQRFPRIAHRRRMERPPCPSERRNRKETLLRNAARTCIPWCYIFASLRTPSRPRQPMVECRQTKSSQLRTPAVQREIHKDRCSLWGLVRAYGPPSNNALRRYRGSLLSPVPRCGHTWEGTPQTLGPGRGSPQACAIIDSSTSVAVMVVFCVLTWAFVANMGATYARKSGFPRIPLADR